MTVESEVRISPANDRTTSPRRGSFMPRFGIRTLLIAGIVASLLFGWLGRNLYRVRQEDAAIEAILQAGGMITQPADMPGTYVIGEIQFDANYAPEADGIGRQFLRALGFSQRPRIQRISLYATDAEDPTLRRALASLHWLPEIEYVSLTGRGVDDSAISALGTLPGLKHLALYDTAITGKGLAKLPAPERLESLDIDAIEPGTDVLSDVRELRGLRQLHVREMPGMTRADVEAIAALPKLAQLELDLNRSTPPGTFAPLAGQPTLGMLHLQAAALDEAEVRALASLPNVETLWVEGASDGDLAMLAQAPKLKTLGLIRTFSPEAARRLSAERPDLTIVHYAPNGSQTFQAGVSDRDSSEPSK